MSLWLGLRGLSEPNKDLAGLANLWKVKLWEHFTHGNTGWRGWREPCSPQPCESCGSQGLTGPVISRREIGSVGVRAFSYWYAQLASPEIALSSTHYVPGIHLG